MEYQKIINLLDNTSNIIIINTLQKNIIKHYIKTLYL